MVKTQLNGKSAVVDYFSSLLVDVQSQDQAQDTLNQPFRFASVEPGYELRVLWRGSLNKHQQYCSDLVLLSCLKYVSGQKLRRAMMKNIKSLGC